MNAAMPERSGLEPVTVLLAASLALSGGPGCTSFEIPGDFDRSSSLMPVEIPVAIQDTQLIGEVAPRPDEQAVELLDPGREPRQVLRYQPEAGHTHRIAMTANTTLRFFAGKSPITAQEVHRGNDLVLRVVEIDGEGTARCEIQLEANETTSYDSTIPGMEAHTRKVFAVLSQYVIRTSITDRGYVSTSDFIPPDDLDGDLYPTFMEMTLGLPELIIVPLPVEAIGPGGRWRATRNFLSSGAFVELATTYEVLELTGNRLRITGSRDVRGQAQPAYIGQEAIMESVTGGASQQFELLLTTPMPIRSEHQSHAETNLVPRQPDEKRRSLRMEFIATMNTETR